MLSTTPKSRSVPLLNLYVFYCCSSTRLLGLRRLVQGYSRHGVRSTVRSCDFENSNNRQVEQLVGSQLTMHLYRVFLAREVRIQ